MKTKLEDYHNEVEITWCPGCGNFPILKTVKQTLVDLDLPPQRVVICSGIGQAPKLPHYMRVNTFNGLHGREVASATAIKLASPDLTVLVHAGDGGAYGEGANHLVHAIRRNIDITLVVHDNKHFSLTKGQVSPTGETADENKLRGFGRPALPLNPLALAISQRCSFVAQATSAKPAHLSQVLGKAICHKGFSLLNVLQPCVVWDKIHTYQYYQERCFEIDSGHDPENFEQAMQLTTTESTRIPIGIIYQNARPEYRSTLLRKDSRTLRDHHPDTPTLIKLMQKYQ